MLPDKVVVDTRVIESIADIIRGITGTSDLMRVVDMPLLLKKVMCFSAEAINMTANPSRIAESDLYLNELTFETIAEIVEEDI